MLVIKTEEQLYSKFLCVSSSIEEAGAGLTVPRRHTLWAEEVFRGLWVNQPASDAIH